MLPIKDNVPTRRFPIVTIALIVANFAVWIFYELPHLQTSINELAFHPCEVEHSCRQIGESWELTAVTSMFMHGSWIHLLGNMLFLWIFGDNVEDYLNPIGFVVFYVIAGLIASLTFVLTDLGSVEPFLGASGAIAGLMGMYLVLWPRARVLTFIILPPFLLYIRASVVLIIWFVLQFFTSPNSGVAWTAHVGGFAFGVLVGLALRRVRPPRVLAR